MAGQQTRNSHFETRGVHQNLGSLLFVYICLVEIGDFLMDFLDFHLYKDG